MKQSVTSETDQKYAEEEGVKKKPKKEKKISTITALRTKDWSKLATIHSLANYIRGTDVEVIL